MWDSSVPRDLPTNLQPRRRRLLSRPKGAVRVGGGAVRYHTGGGGSTESWAGIPRDSPPIKSSAPKMSVTRGNRSTGAVQSGSMSPGWPADARSRSSPIGARTQARAVWSTLTHVRRRLECAACGCQRDAGKAWAQTQRCGLCWGVEDESNGKGAALGSRGGPATPNGTPRSDYSRKSV